MKSIIAAALLLLSACTAIGDGAGAGRSGPGDCYPGARPECRGLSTG